jgi:hypothetical protein
MEERCKIIAELLLADVEEGKIKGEHLGRGR